MVRFISTPLLLFFMREASAQAAQGLPAADLDGSLWPLVLGLATVLALIFGSLWVLKRLGGQGGGAGILRVVAGTAVGTRERVVIVEVGSTWLVLGVAPGHVSALAEVPRQSAAAQAASRDSPSAGAGIPDWLRKLTQRR